LSSILRILKNNLANVDTSRLLAGLDSPDDAAVYKLDEETAIIFTVDFFTPIVDDPYAFGAIAAANAMSDVYAMGGEVLLAVNICAFPTDLPEHVICEILRGGVDKVNEAGGIIVGGHTVDDREPKYGLAVVGIVHPARVIKKAGALPSDILVLTKPIGSGLIATAAKAGIATKEHVEAAISTMMKLNKDTSKAMQAVGVHAATDITGFSLLGHALEMAQQSNVGLRIKLSSIPLIEGAVEYAKQFLFPAGTCSNEKAYGEHVKFAESIPQEMRMLLFTPETSGGLLIAVPDEKLNHLIDELTLRSVDYWLIGEVIEGEGIEVTE